MTQANLLKCFKISVLVGEVGTLCPRRGGIKMKLVNEYKRLINSTWGKVNSQQIPGFVSPQISECYRAGTRLYVQPESAEGITQAVTRQRLFWERKHMPTVGLKLRRLHGGPSESPLSTATLKATKILKCRQARVSPLLVAKGKQGTWQSGAAAWPGVGGRFQVTAVVAGENPGLGSWEERSSRETNPSP